ncbi:MAG TPA: NUDIX domain-containing protein [Bacillales bacterium]|nr:NUDIX domain-containing protein [Bacillales bacterium]
MIYRRKTYKIDPQHYERFNAFFHEYLYPNQMKHGAKLVGRWGTEAKDEITAIWAYDSMEAYERIEQAVREDDMHRKAQERRQQMKPLFYESKQDFLNATGDYQPPRHIATVGGYITNEAGEVLLVKTYWRDDTWEIPGGQVEEGETLDDAVKREIEEESGIIVELDGVCSVYQNVTTGIVSVQFAGKAIGGRLRTSDETKEVAFVKLSPETISEYVTRQHFQSRVLDAMKGELTPCHLYRVRPYELIRRLEG